MNEVIEKCYQAEFGANASCLFNDEIGSKWEEIVELVESVFDISTQNDIHSLIGDVWSETAKISFETGFRAAFKFLMNL